ncbi:MAG: hypothetical protein JKP90_15440 [Desulfofustis sp. PB-SRB1]|nr:hypothetical protein [Desulfofustis sp. PB-SRB1]
MSRHILSIDQGTTSSRAIVFNETFDILGLAQQEFEQFFPQSGWVEHEPEDIWKSSLETCRQALSKSSLSGRDIAAIGITNQRETTILWDRATGEPVYRAIVWQDRRTSEYCNELREGGHGELVTAKTGLLIDPYFSATKIQWILENVAGAREKAEKGALAFGTVDSFLLWRMTGGRVHATDATNAARTMLFNIHDNCWDDELLEVLQIPSSLLPDVYDSSAEFGMTDAGDVRCAGACLRYSRRPAGRPGRSGMFSAGNAQSHLRYRLLCRAQYRFRGSVLHQQTPDHDWLSY